MIFEEMLKNRRLELLPHPTQQAISQNAALYASVEVKGSVIRTQFEYESETLQLKVPALKQSAPVRADELWKTTCFEIFLQPEGRKNYWEVNFAPRGDWNIYEFASYRENMKPEIRLAGPKLETLNIDERKCVCAFSVDLTPLALRHWEMRIGLTAVLEAVDGSKTYWAIKHASEKPDFHKIESFNFRAMIGT